MSIAYKMTGKQYRDYLKDLKPTPKLKMAKPRPKKPRRTANVYQFVLPSGNDDPCVEAMTASEARAEAKRSLGLRRLPVGTVCTLVGRRRAVA